MIHRIANAKSGTRARLICNELLCRRSELKRAPSSYRPTTAYSHSSNRPIYFDAGSVKLFALPSTPLSHQNQTRLFWSFSDEAEAEIKAKSTEEAPIPPLPVPPITPSNVSATSIIAHSTVESLKSLPECQSVLDLLNGSNTPAGDGSIDPARVKEAESNLKRARDILQSLPELQLATHLLEADLLSLCGKFDLALECLARYEYWRNKLATTKINSNERKQLQFLRAKLFVHSGQFAHALSEYEDLLEGMEKEVEQQMQNKGDDRLPVIHGASALTGVGVTKLLMHVREGSDDGGGHNSNATKNEIIESIETATDMLLESRKEALLSPKYARLAVDLGLAASISLTNLGVAHFLLYKDKKRSIEYWERGLETLDAILKDAMQSATIIPNWAIQCMESVRARLHCNISWTLLGLDALHSVGREFELLDKVSDETLKNASDAAKKALDISDELINGSKFMREDEGGNHNGNAEGNDETTEEGASNQQEWERILKEKAKEKRDAANGSDESTIDDKPNELPLSPLWTAYHRAESARALGLVAQCYASAGAAVTAEGLFQSALDASSSFPLGQSVNSRGCGGGRGVSSSSPNLGLIARDVLLGYAMLCGNWEKRNGDADRLRSNALKIEETGVLKGFVRGDDGTIMPVSGLESSLWLFGPLDFER